MEIISIILVILLLIMTLTPIVYFSSRKTIFTGGSGGPMEYAQNVEQGHHIVVRTYYPRWPPKFFDTWLTPRFDVFVQNHGLPIDSGFVYLRYYYYSDEPTPPPSSWLDIRRGTFFMKDLENFEPGDSLSFRAAIGTHPIEANRPYQLEVITIKGIPLEAGGYRAEPIFYYRMQGPFRALPFANLLAIIGIYLGLFISILLALLSSLMIALM